LIYFIKLLVLILILQSCNSFPDINYNCNSSYKELSTRHNLFNKISDSERQSRSKTSLKTNSDLDKNSVLSHIVNSIKAVDRSSDIIPVDLRYYKHVFLGNIIVSNIKSDFALNLFLKTSKYSQETFSLINFGKEKITIFWPIRSKKGKYIISRSDLQDVELLINVSGSKNIVSNMKFTKNQEISILAKNIINPFSLDLREASNHQFNTGNKWLMNVYDISNSSIKGGKDTSGYYLYVNNKNSKISIHRFDKSKVQCYFDPYGPKFEENITAKARKS